MHGLPRAATPLIAREAELACIEAALADGARWVTLIGPGGTGKTRLATAFVEQRGCGAFAPLAATTTAGQICAVVARAIGLPLTRRVRDPAAAIGDELAARGSTLLVLDNAEQITTALAELVARWLVTAPTLRVVVTSRWPLDGPDEAVVRVPPLDVEQAGDRSDAGRLFVAAAPWGTVADDAASRGHVEAIVRRVEGNPLAIELAAARLELLTLPRLVERLDAHLGSGLKMLRDPARPGARHGTLWNLIDWSHALLSPAEQTALRQAAVFADGFTLEAAEAVIAVPDLEPLDALHGLRRRALLRVDHTGRFRLHALVLEYATVRLAEADDRAAVEARHAAYYLAVGAVWSEQAIGPDAAEIMGRLETELPNFVAVHHRALAVTPPTPVAARRAMGALQALHPLQYGHLSATDLLAMAAATRELVEQVDHGQPDVFVELLRREARALRYVGRMGESMARLARGLAVARTLDDRVPEARLLTTMSEVSSIVGDNAAARSTAEQALALHEVAGDRRWAGMNRMHLASVNCAEGRFDDARREYARAVADFEVVGDTYFLALATTNLATVQLEQGDPAGARVRFEQALARYETLGNPRSVAIGRHYLGLCDHHSGHLEAAEQTYRPVIETLDALGARRFASFVRYFLAVLRLERHDPTRALALFASAGETLRGLADPHYAPLCQLGRAAAAARAHRRDPVEEDRARAVIAALDETYLHPAVELLDAAIELGPRSDAATVRRWVDRAAELARAEGDDLRLLARVIAAWAADAADAAASWTIAADGAWFRPPDGPRVDVAHRAAPSRILAALAAARRAGRTLDRDAAITAGWPDEMMASSSAGNRLRVALSTLRKMGLGELIQRAPKRALQLDPTVRVRVEG